MGHHDKVRYRSVWISDLHLGSRACRVEPLLAFISSIECEFLYLVGDIVDVWSMKRRFYWPQSHNDVVRKILKRASRGARVIFIPGNHDEVFRAYGGMQFGGVEIRVDAMHETADGRKMLILHGDEFDEVVRNMHLITALGDWMYDILLGLNRVLNWFRRRMGRPYWSLAAFIKRKVKYICQFVSNYEQSLVRYAKQRGADIVLTGHIHRPEIKALGDVLYCNDGDFVENCTALVEHLDGRLELLHVERDLFAPARAQAPAGSMVESEAGALA
jgi:UDP-2,3-diacylglucosamine pyrophosphatase LpxH